MTPQFAGLLLRVSAPDALGFTAAADSRRLSVGGVEFELEPLFPRADGDAFAATAADVRPVWLRAKAPDTALAGANPWDLIHDAVSATAPFAAAAGVDFVEPDLVQSWPFVHTPSAACQFDDQEAKNGKIPVGREFAWHLSAEYSGLVLARQAIGVPGDGDRVRIAHLDTGYSEHDSKPLHLRLDLQRNFVDDRPPDNAEDPFVTGPALNPGHGIGTLGILAGGRFAFRNTKYSFDDFLGGAPHADVVPVRVAKSVIQLYTSSIARGIDYAASLRTKAGASIHVLSMSLGGLPSQAWADAVNRAYDAGVVLVTAAGNHFSAGFVGALGRSIVYPARFGRVIAACGVMANFRSYHGLPFGTMQGNWGPRSKMGTAMAAFTPNIPWAQWGCRHVVDMDGRGTSAATPQIAAAAALYMQKHRSDLEKYAEPWMAVEAVRHALFSTADQNASGVSEQEVGNGALRANDALGVQPLPAADLVKTKEDSARFGLMKVLFGGLGFGIEGEDPRIGELLAQEASQVFMRGEGLDQPNPFEIAIPDPDAPDIPLAQQKTFLQMVVDRPDDEISNKLRQRAEQLLQQRFSSPTVPTFSPSDAERAARKGSRIRPRRSDKPADAPQYAAATEESPAFRPPVPPYRALRGFAADPSLATRLETAPVSVVTFNVRWEEHLQPGPSGEYVEVIDHDPASRCFYDPVDLNDHDILAQDGLPPSEGTPQFHQQMAYAVAMKTIQNFEHALGRRALWRAGPPRPGADPKDDSHYVGQLRVYPHALREPNAYYSPQKIALLFGYYQASSDDPAGHMPGSTVFSCLSHDIVAHETTHALLDGMHRRYVYASNPDVRAFHEAFADIVALFQHFTYPDILRHQIATTRGELRWHENLLGQLAGEFGRTTGRRGALRDAIGRFDPVLKEWVPHQPKPEELNQKFEAHSRGGILVGAIFDAFLSIYERRTGDLLRLATGGSGVLQPGAIHPDLVNRLANEAAKSARHVLGMCIRALDYCPPVDITFGEYLRAVITADADLVTDDDLGYRVAFIEAFRRRGIYPIHVRSLSEESLRWRRAEFEQPQPSARLRAALQRLGSYAQGQPFSAGREEIFFRSREARREIHGWLLNHFMGNAASAGDAKFLGIDPTRFKPDTEIPSFEVHALRMAWRECPDGGVAPQIILTLLQDKLVPVDGTIAGGEQMVVEGGCTVVGNLQTQQISYCIRKNLTSDTRLARQREFALHAGESLAATYFGAPQLDRDEAEPFALIHRGG